MERLLYLIGDNKIMISFKMIKNYNRINKYFYKQLE